MPPPLPYLEGLRVRMHNHINHIQQTTILVVTERERLILFSLYLFALTFCLLSFYPLLSLYPLRNFLANFVCLSLLFLSRCMYVFLVIFHYVGLE